MNVTLIIFGYGLSVAYGIEGMRMFLDNWPWSPVFDYFQVAQWSEDEG
ncbi:MAG: hypothetical protein ABR985_06425 [Methanotrichaceae archaeon]